MRGCSLFMLAGLLASAPRVQGWTADNLPNPLEQPEACGRAVPGWVCSPDGLVDAAALDTVAGHVQAIFRGDSPYALLSCPGHAPVPLELLVVIVRKVGGYGSAKSRVKTFAKGVHDRFGVGDARCQSGAVFVVSVDDRQAYISVGRGVKRFLRKSQIHHIIREMGDDMRAQRYGDALIKSTVAIGLSVARGEKRADDSDYDYDYDDDGDDDEDTAWSIGVPVLFAFFGIFACCSHSRRERGRQVATAQFQRLERGMQDARNGSYVSTTCPICFEAFSPPPNSSGGSPMPDPVLPAPGGPAAPIPSAPPLPVAPGPSPPQKAADAAGEYGRQAAEYERATGEYQQTVLEPTAKPAATQQWPPAPEHHYPPVPAVPVAGGVRAADAVGAGEYGAQEDAPLLPAASPPEEAQDAGRKEACVLACGHAFCEECLEGWLSKNSSCPICRQPVQQGVGVGSRRTVRRGNRWRRGWSWAGTRAIRPLGYDLFEDEMLFRLDRLHRRHPRWVTRRVVNDFERAARDGTVFHYEQHPDFVREVSAATSQSRQADGASGWSHSFGGGHSSGGGGGGGSW